MDLPYPRTPKDAFLLRFPHHEHVLFYQTALKDGFMTVFVAFIALKIYEASDEEIAMGFDGGIERVCLVTAIGALLSLDFHRQDNWTSRLCIAFY